MSDDKPVYPSPMDDPNILPASEEELPDGIELTVVDSEIVTNDDASVDVLALAQEDMASADSRDEELPPLETELSNLLNRYSAESVSGTPDFIIAKFLLNTLKEFNEAVSHRAWWRGEFVDFNPSRDVRYFDHFSGEELEHPSDERVKRYQETGKFETYEQWKARIASQE